MLRLLTLLLLAIALVACGDDESPAPASDELTGTSWTVSLRTSELEDPPDDLRDSETQDWQLSFERTAMRLVNESMGEIVNPMSVDGDVLKVDAPVECKWFSYAVERDELVLTPVYPCQAESFKSVLTHKPWKRSDA